LHRSTKHNALACASGIALALGGATASAQTAQSSAGADLTEVVVTATRSAEVLSRVPISVSAFSQEKMDKQGIKQFTDLVRYTPGLAFNSSPWGQNDVSIRGIRSTAGASTTGIYIDDVPIQVRQVGYASGTIFPAVFDLERIEVLRGPQGTLFGSGSQGGTVRFIQPAPSVERYSAYGRLEGSMTPKAEGSYEAGVAVGGPIVQDKLGFRVSAFYRRDGGWIDQVPATFNVVSDNGALYGDSIIFTPTGKGDKNHNHETVAAFRGALKLAPTENLSITPSVFFQQRKTGTGNGSFWLSGSDPGAGRFVTPNFSPGPVTPTSGFTQLSLPDSDEGDVSLLLGSIGVEWALDGVTLYSTSSYLRQYKKQYYDFTSGYERGYLGQPVARTGAKGVGGYDDLQNSYVQEVRLQSDPTQRLKWVLGGFFQTSAQSSKSLIELNTFFHADSFFGIPNLDNGSPFGPGFNNTQNIWGAPMLGESGVYFADTSSRERQVAGFGQVDFKLTEQITLTAGARLSRNWLRYTLFSDGPENNLNTPFGAECPTGPVCPFNSGGPFAPSWPGGTVRTAENAFTPKVGINFQMDPENLFYVSVAKGYRPGGAQVPLPSACDADLKAWGYVDAGGNAVTPLTYDSDTVWSYEAGSKNSRLFGGLASFSGSAYIIKWKNIQTEMSVPTCGYSFVDNLSSATVKGFDAQLDLRAVDGGRNHLRRGPDRRRSYSVAGRALGPVRA
jgi:outer membrane receptor protein involved in Fe transport